MRLHCYGFYGFTLVLLKRYRTHFRIREAGVKLQNTYPYFPTDVQSLVEPIFETGAITIAAISHELAKRLTLNNLNKPLMDL